MPLSRFRENPDPKKLNVGVGLDIEAQCNLRCRQCFREKGPAPKRLMALDKIKFILGLTANSFSEAYLLGGEPTLHPEIKEILRACLEKFPEVILVTNGLKLADERFCRDIALPGLKIAMHRRAIRPDAQETVDYLAGKKGAFQLYQRAWANVEKYWQGEVCVQTNILKPLLLDGHCLDVFKWARQRGYEPVIELTKPGPIFARGNALDVSPEEVARLYGEMLSHDQEFFPGLLEKMPPFVPPSYGHNCLLAETSIHILIDGTVVACISYAPLALGNIFTDDLGAILNSPVRLAIQDYRNWIVGPCRSCPHFEFCHGGCRGESFWDTGCPRASDPYCWHLPKGLSPRDFVPQTCSGCALENHPGCQPKKNW